MKLAIVYDSKTGNTAQCGQWIAEGAAKVEGVEAKCFAIESVDEDFVKEAGGVILGSPSYYALMTANLRTWLLEKGGKLNLAGKLGGAYATEQYTHGGGDLVIQSILTNEMALGMLCYSSGGAFGHPVIHLGPVGVNHNKEKVRLEDFKDYFTIYGERFAAKAAELFQ